MAQELAHTSLPLVHRCRRLQETRTQVNLALPHRQPPDHERLRQGLGIGWSNSSRTGGISFECDRSCIEFARRPGLWDIVRGRVGPKHLLTTELGSMT